MAYIAYRQDNFEDTPYDCSLLGDTFSYPFRSLTDAKEAIRKDAKEFLVEDEVAEYYIINTAEEKITHFQANLIVTYDIELNKKD